MMNDDFAVFILTHERVDNLRTLGQLLESGYTGKWYLIIDDEDKQKEEYIEKYGKDRVIQFNKVEAEKTFDIMDNFEMERKACVWARNATWKIARDLGLRYFMQLDDDYRGFHYVGDANGVYRSKKKIGRMDDIINALLDYLKENPRVLTIAMAQGGDFLGGGESQMFVEKYRRKAMNSFILDTEREFPFPGRLNEDMNASLENGMRGDYIVLSCGLVRLTQTKCATSEGGNTFMYKKMGFFLQSYYSIMMMPSHVTAGGMGQTDKRLHTCTAWRFAVPKILRESEKK